MAEIERIKQGTVRADGRVFYQRQQGREYWMTAEQFRRTVTAPREAKASATLAKRLDRQNAKMARKAKWEADMKLWAETRDARRELKREASRIKSIARRNRLRTEDPWKLREEERRQSEKRKSSPKRLAWLAARKAETKVRKDARATEIAARREVEAQAKDDRRIARESAVAERKRALELRPRIRRKILTPEQRLEAKRLEKANHKHRRRCLIRDQDVKATPSQIRELKKSAKGRCFYCREKHPLTQDHITPISKGGTHTLDNIVFACHPCNSEKRDLSPEEYGRKHGMLLV